MRGGEDVMECLNSRGVRCATLPYSQIEAVAGLPFAKQTKQTNRQP
jgi:hypothetical protein